MLEYEVGTVVQRIDNPELFGPILAIGYNDYFEEEYYLVDTPEYVANMFYDMVELWIDQDVEEDS